MKAIVYSSPEYPEILQLQELAKPVSKDHEVLIKIHATTVMTTDVGSDFVQKRLERFSLASTTYRPVRTNARSEWHGLGRTGWDWLR